jgi:hypothetical protein
MRDEMQSSSVLKSDVPKCLAIEPRKRLLGWMGEWAASLNYRSAIR